MAGYNVALPKDDGDYAVLKIRGAPESNAALYRVLQPYAKDWHEMVRLQACASAHGDQPAVCRIASSMLRCASHRPSSYLIACHAVRDGRAPHRHDQLSSCDGGVCFETSNAVDCPSVAL